jgi:FkbM family methyltransferase
MRLPANLRGSLKRLLRRQDLVVERFSQSTAFEAVASRLAARHPDVATVIDIGASDGRWSGQMMGHLPAAAYFLVEAQQIHEAGLRRFAAAHANCTYAIAAAGARSGVLHFDADDPFGGQARAERRSASDLEVAAVAIDDAVRERALRAPFLLKLDTHGFELPILEGASDTLAQTAAVIMECYNFRIAPGSLLFHEMCRHMETCGFRCIDLCAPMFRPRDGVLWQMDLVFARSERPEFAHGSYR